MHDIDHDLPELMQRATRGLRPDTTAVVRRAMRIGVRRQRVRTAAVCVAAASAVVLTGVGVTSAFPHHPSNGGNQSTIGFAGPAHPSVSKPSAKPSTKPSSKPSAKPSDKVGSHGKTLAILLKVVPKTLKTYDRTHWGFPDFYAASITVDDGKGASELMVSIERQAPLDKCPTVADDRVICKVLPDGSVVTGAELAPVYEPSPKFPNGRPNDYGVKFNAVELHRTDGVVITLTSYTSRDEKNSPKTRERPPFTIDNLISMARSKLWDQALPQESAGLCVEPKTSCSKRTFPK